MNNKKIRQPKAVRIKLRSTEDFHRYEKPDWSPGGMEKKTQKAAESSSFS